MKVLLLSAYAAQSHRQWVSLLQQMFSEWSWSILELPPRHFSWRIRGNPLHWAVTERALLEQDYDLLIATSMVDLASLRGLVPALASVPTVLYFHENQFAYPLQSQATSQGQAQSQSQQNLLEAQMVTLYAGLAADRLLFNSAYNRDSYIAGVDALLGRLPDFVPAGVANSLLEKSAVLPVPVQPGAVPADGCWPSKPNASRPLRLLWVGRFEYDKGGDRLLALLRLLDRRAQEQRMDFELAVIGQQFRDSPVEFGLIEKEFGSRLVAFGYLEDRAQYENMLAAADVVLSTAIHEFQGLAVMEAVASGCIPVVPDRLAYAELFSRQYRYPSHPSDIEREASGAAQLLQSLAAQFAAGNPPAAPRLVDYSCSALLEAYRHALTSVARKSPRSSAAAG